MNGNMVVTKRQPGRKGGLVPTNEKASPIVDFVSVKNDVGERYLQIPRRERFKYLAYASVVWGVNETVRLTGLSRGAVQKARQRYSHLVQEMNHVKVEVAAQVYLNKALEIADSIDIGDIPNERKAQSVKALMDACDIAKLQGIRTNGEVEADETVELFYRVKRKLRAASRHDDGGEENEEGGEKIDRGGAGSGVIDVTGEIEEVKKN